MEELVNLHQVTFQPHNTQRAPYGGNPDEIASIYRFVHKFGNVVDMNMERWPHHCLVTYASAATSDYLINLSSLPPSLQSKSSTRTIKASPSVSTLPPRPSMRATPFATPPISLTMDRHSTLLLSTASAPSSSRLSALLSLLSDSTYY